MAYLLVEGQSEDPYTTESTHIIHFNSRYQSNLTSIIKLLANKVAWAS